MMSQYVYTKTLFIFFTGCACKIALFRVLSTQLKVNFTKSFTCCDNMGIDLTFGHFDWLMAQFFGGKEFEQTKMKNHKNQHGAQLLLLFDRFVHPC